MTLETAVSSTLSAVQEAHALDGVKNYLRIDGDYDDAAVFMCLQAAWRYVVEAVGEMDETNPTAMMLLYAITQDFYENRELMQMDIQQRKRQQYMYQSIILQLQTGLIPDEEG
jgi:uncharacterized phage protein (predicted DNA packaging)